MTPTTTPQATRPSRSSWPLSDYLDDYRITASLASRPHIRSSTTTDHAHAAAAATTTSPRHGNRLRSSHGARRRRVVADRRLRTHKAATKCCMSWALQPLHANGGEGTRCLPPASAEIPPRGEKAAEPSPQVLRGSATPTPDGTSASGHRHKALNGLREAQVKPKTSLTASTRPRPPIRPGAKLWQGPHRVRLLQANAEPACHPAARPTRAPTEHPQGPTRGPLLVHTRPKCGPHQISSNPPMRKNKKGPQQAPLTPISRPKLAPFKPT